MKNKKILICIAVVLIVVIAGIAALKLTGKKDSYDYQANLPGEHVAYHWFYDMKDGDSGFYDTEAHFVFGSDGSYTQTGGALDEGVTVSGTYSFTDTNTIRIELEDGSFDEMMLRYSSDHNTIEMTNNATKYAVSLEKPE